MHTVFGALEAFYSALPRRLQRIFAKVQETLLSVEAEGRNMIALNAVRTRCCVVDDASR